MTKSTGIKTFILISAVAISLGSISHACADTLKEQGGCADQNVAGEKTSPCPEPPGFACAEQCAIEREVAREECEITYDIGLCFGLLSCIEDTEVARDQCINIANAIFFGCASRCYREFLNNGSQ